MEKIKIYNNIIGVKEKQLFVVKVFIVKLGIYCELGLDSLLICLYSEDEVVCVENFVEELVMEKIIGQFYIMGVFYELECIIFFVFVMIIELIVYSFLVFDK